MIGYFIIENVSLGLSSFPSKRESLTDLAEGII
jgi:hypothetical protein